MITQNQNKPYRWVQYHNNKVTAQFAALLFDSFSLPTRDGAAVTLQLAWDELLFLLSTEWLHRLIHKHKKFCGRLK
jgi:hypothetical protein